MANSYGRTFARRGPDLLTEALVAVLCKNGSYELKPLFDLVHENLRVRNAAGSSEELLRLRIYEKLQQLVKEGKVKKTMAKEGKKYRGTASLSAVPPLVPAKD